MWSGSRKAPAVMAASPGSALVTQSATTTGAGGSGAVHQVNNARPRWMGPRRSTLCFSANKNSILWFKIVLTKLMNDPKVGVIMT